MPIQIVSRPLGPTGSPLTNLQVTIDVEHAPDPGAVPDYVYEVRPVVRGSNHVFCLDYLSNPLSEDTVKVKRAATNGNGGVIDQGLLQHVSSNAIDFSGIVLKKIARTFFIARSGNAGFQTQASTAAAQAAGDDKGDKKVAYRAVAIEFDPLSPAELAEANERFVQFGLCLTLGRYSYDTARLKEAGRYCDDPVTPRGQP